MMVESLILVSMILTAAGPPSGLGRQQVKGEAATAMACRSSEPSKCISADWDGDGIDDSVCGTRGSEVQISLTKSARKLKVASCSYNHNIMCVQPVPPELLALPSDAARIAVEDLLFGAVCEKPDPSLQRLMEEPSVIRWHPGSPAILDNYATYSTDAGFIRRWRAQAGPEMAEAKVKAVWVEYLSGTHRDMLSRTELRQDFRILAEEPDRSLLGTSHGVVLVDRRKGQYAWIYVHPGGQVLRFSTIKAARFEKNNAVVSLSLGQYETIGDARIDLATGQTRTRFCKWRDDFGEERRECPGAEQLESKLEDVTFKTKDGEFNGELLVPPRRRNTQVPALVFVAAGEWEPGRAVLEALESMLWRAGFVVLRYNKRSSQDQFLRESKDIETHIADVEAAADYLVRRPEVQRSRVFVLGYGQGAELLPELLRRRADLAGGVLLSAAFNTANAMVGTQVAAVSAILKGAGLTDTTINDVLASTFSKRLTLPGEQRAEVWDCARLLVGLKELSANLEGMEWGNEMVTDIDRAPLSFWRSWIDLGKRRPDVVTKVKAPLLVVSGSLDWRTPPSETERWREVFSAVEAKTHHRAVVLEGLDGAFRRLPAGKAPSCGTYRYWGSTDNTIDSKLVETIVGFLRSGEK
jgi:predicted esterase